MNKFLVGAGAMCAAAVATSAPAAVNLLANGSFENGSFVGWTTSFNEGTDLSPGETLPVVIAYGQSSPYPTGAFGESIPADPLTGGATQDAGRFAAYFSSDSATLETISQSISVVAGTNYTFGFDYYLPANGQVNPNNATFTASFGGTQFARLSAASQPARQWQTITGTFTAGTTGTDTIALNFSSLGFPAKDFVIDRVFVSSTTSLVPEPASWAMMVGGFGLLGMTLRRKRAGMLFA